MPVDTGYGTCGETWKQATSYCETALELAVVGAPTRLPA
jgi:hypothetical protein